MKKYLKFFRKLSFKTLFFNLKYLPLKQALKFPVLISKRVYLQKVSGKIRFDCPVEPGLIQIGYGGVGIFDSKRSRSVWDVSGIVIFKGKARIGAGSKISVGTSGILEFGDNFRITAESSIMSFCHVRFGNNCLLSWEILIMDTDFHKLKDREGRIINAPEPVIIGNHVWIGCKCLILKSSTIPDGCVIGANSLITGILPNENSVYAGNPVKCLKENISWEV